MAQKKSSHAFRFSYNIFTSKESHLFPVSDIRGGAGGSEGEEGGEEAEQGKELGREQEEEVEEEQ